MRPIAKILLLAAVASSCAWAGVESGHPNIIAAREHVEHALERLHQAQVANAYDLDGHAAKAEQLLRQALEEMRLAAAAANRNR